jgi:hypothetical protein
VSEYLVDHRRIFDAGDDLDETCAIATFISLLEGPLWPTTEKKSTKPKLDSAPLSSPNRPSTYEAVFIPFRPDTEVRQAIFSIALKEVLA